MSVLGVREFLARAGSRGEISALEGPRVLAVIAGSGGAYGAVMAAFGGVSGERVWMVAFGAVKVPMLFVATMALAIPCFAVLNLLAGLGADWRRVWRALVDYQVAVALQLGALAPVTFFLNLVESDYRVAQAWSTLMFAIAAWNARLVLLRAYAPLEAASPAHRNLRRVWFVLYAFVGLQMGWDLRPFVGSPDMGVAFFRQHIGNAWIEVPKVLWEAVVALWG